MREGQIIALRHLPLLSELRCAKVCPMNRMGIRALIAIAALASLAMLLTLAGY